MGGLGWPHAMPPEADGLFFFKFIYSLFEGLVGKEGSQCIILCEKPHERLNLRAAQIIKLVLVRKELFERLATDIPLVNTFGRDQSKREPP